MLDYVMFFRCTFWIRSVGRSSPAMAVYIPQRQTQALLSGEKLSTLVLFWLCVWSSCRTLENCSRRLVGVQSQAPECSGGCLNVNNKVKLLMLVYKRMPCNYINLDLYTKCGLFASGLCFLINKRTSNSETLNQNEKYFDRWSFKGDI